MKRLAEELLAHGIRPSYQRVRVWSYLSGTKEHPSAEAIYTALAPEIPTLSRTTVYNSLKLFSERRLAVHLVVDETEARWDADTSQHGHFICESCRRVLDLPLEGSQPRLPAGYVATRVEYSCFGLCAACAAASESL